MLSSISWQQYLAAIVILTLFYYLYILLRYYQKEIGHLLNRQQKQSNIFSGVASPIQVMGAAKLDNGVSISNTGDLQFGETSPDEIKSPAVSASDPSQELVMEAANLIEAFKDIDNKPEFLSLLKILIGSYQRFQDEIDFSLSLNRILEISKKKLQFPVTLGDLQSASV